jgi:hypothetical protein
MPKLAIEITANSSSYTQATEQVRRESKRMVAQIREDATEARHGLHLVTEEIGIEMPRALQGWIAKVPAVREAMSAAFNTIAVLALINVLVEAGRKVAEFVEKQREAAEKNQEAWAKITQSVNQGNDALQVANDRLVLSIAKFEKKPTNGLKLAIDEAIQSANQLGVKLNEDIAKIGQVLKGQQVGVMGRLLGSARTDDLTGHAHNLSTRLEGIDEEGREKLEGLRTRKASQVELDKAQREIDEQRQQAINEERKWAQGQLASAHQSQEQRQKSMSTVSGLAQPSALAFAAAAEAHPDQTKRIEQLSHYSAGLGSMSDFNQLSIENRDLTGQNAVAEAQAHNRDLAKQAAEKAKQAREKAQKAFGDMIEIMVVGNKAEIEQAQRVLSEVEAYWASLQRGNDEFDRMRQEADRAATRLYIEGVQSKIQTQRDVVPAAQKQLQSVERTSSGRVAMGQESEGQRVSEVHNAIVAEVHESIAALLKVLDLLTSIGKGASAEAEKVRDEIVATEQQGLEQLQELHAQYSRQIQEKWLNALSGVNGQVAAWATGSKTNWSGMFRGEASGYAQSALRTGERAILNGLGVGGKADGSQSNPFYVKDADGAKGKSAVSGSAGSVAGGLLGKLNDSNFLGGLMGGKLFGAGSFFGKIGSSLGGLALGGDALMSGVYDVGEQGPERVYLPAGSHVASHQPSSSQTTLHIDARGTDPSLTRANFERAIANTHRQAVSDAMHAQSEYSRRVPH